VSSASTIKWCKESSSIVQNVNITSSIATEITNYNSTASSNNAHTDTTTDANKISTSTTVSAETLQVTKCNGTLQILQQEKLQRRLDRLMRGLDQRYVHTHVLCHKIVRGLYPLISTTELDVLASETSATMSTRHPDYARLTVWICISNNHKHTSNSFTKSMMKLDTTKAKDEGNNDGNFLSPQILQLLQKRGKEIDDYIQHDRDYHLSYFGYKTLEKSNLLKDRCTQEVIERPQYMFMRVALGIHCSANINTANNAIEEHDDNTTTALLLKVFETYDHLSQGYFMHAPPTLFHSGTSYPQLSSCFLVQMSDDSIDGIYNTLKRCALISKATGGIGLSVHNIRARGSFTRGTGGVSNSIVPMLRVYDGTSRYIDQGRGKRPGAFAIYIEPWNADTFDVLSLKKNHGKEEHRARDLFYGLWIPDIFMKRIQDDDYWLLMCPDTCPGLQSHHGPTFDKLYTSYEQMEGL
jgi:ribonucleotide reductase alpha subunit